MSFLRSLRDSLSRTKVSAVAQPVTQSEGSALASHVGVLRRGDTFILSSENAEGDRKAPTSNRDFTNSMTAATTTSSLDKKPKKSNMFRKFMRKKTTASNKISRSDTEISDEAAHNAHHNRCAEGGCHPTPDHDSQSDPFHFLYEQPSSLKELQKEAANATECNGSAETSNTSFYSVTSRRSSKDCIASVDLQKNTAEEVAALSRLQHNEQGRHRAKVAEVEKPQKYGTVTLHSFRKSFRERMLQQITEAPHNPAWFVEVEQNPAAAIKHSADKKQGRTDLLVFENENYKPLSQSPIFAKGNVRDQRSSHTRSTVHSVKRNETFRIGRPLLREAAKGRRNGREAAGTATKKEPAIHIEFKNSIMPNTPGRVVPVGVAKPMPSLPTPRTQQHNARPPRAIRSPVRNSGGSANKTNNNNNINIPPKVTTQTWSKATPPAVAVSSQQHRKFFNAPNRPRRYQTMLHIFPSLNLTESHQEVSTALKAPSKNCTPIRIQLKANNGNGTNGNNGNDKGSHNTHRITPTLLQLRNHYNATSARAQQHESLPTVQSSLGKVPLCAPAVAPKKQSTRVYFGGSQSWRGIKSNSNEMNSERGGTLSGDLANNNNKQHTRFISSLGRAKEQPIQRQRSLSVAQTQRRTRSPKIVPWR